MKIRNLLLFCCLSVFCLSAFAASDDQDYQLDENPVTWTQTVILRTMSASYAQTISDQFSISQNYTLNAWSAINNFFSDILGLVNSEQLVLHPELTIPATLVYKGNYQGIQFWRVHMAVFIPEVSTNIDFSVLIIRRIPDAANKSQFLIQSLNIIRGSI